MTLTDKEKPVMLLHYYRLVIQGQLDRSQWAAIREQCLVAVMRGLI